MSLPTKGRVLIVTTVGDIEIELWATVLTSLSSIINSEPSVGDPQSVSKLHRTCSRGYASFTTRCESYESNFAFFKGYYDGVIFHRVVPDFLVQTGDRTGTGGGGESFYGGV